jgi:hypothetical protein
MAFFEQEKQKRDQRREEIARGPGMGAEVGSAEAVRFAADAINASIAKTAVPEEPVRLQRDVARKTAEMLIAQREANARQEVQIELAKMQLAEMKANGFQRIR